MRARLKAIVERGLGIRIFRQLPFGLDRDHDLQCIPHWDARGIAFDVGSNVGQSVLELTRDFPAAPIFAFESTPDTFAELTGRTSHLRNVRRFNVAMGSAPGVAQIFQNRRSEMNTLRDDLRTQKGFQDQGQALVTVQTIDASIAEHGIDFVQFLKIDTEGFDLEVLKGAERALTEHRVGVVQVEAGMLQDEGKFIPLETFRAHLRERGFLLFGIYEQVRVRLTRFRRCNAVFISEPFAERG